MTLKLAIFDLDGTLLNTLTDLTSAVNFALLKTGHPARSYQEVRRFIGNGVQQLMWRALPEGTSEADFLEAYRVFLAHYAVIKAATTKPYPGVNSVLQHLKQNGVVLAVLSNKYDGAVKELCAQMLPLIEDAQGESATVLKKPDPSGVRCLMEKHHATCAETVLVGDSETDLQTAHAAGVAAVAVLWGAREGAELAPYLPSVMANSAEELINYFCNVWGTKK